MAAGRPLFAVRESISPPTDGSVCGFEYSLDAAPQLANLQMMHHALRHQLAAVGQELSRLDPQFAKTPAVSGTELQLITISAAQQADQLVGSSGVVGVAEGPKIVMDAVAANAAESAVMATVLPLQWGEALQVQVEEMDSLDPLLELRQVLVEEPRAARAVEPHDPRLVALAESGEWAVRPAVGTHQKDDVDTAKSDAEAAQDEARSCGADLSSVPWMARLEKEMEQATLELQLEPSGDASWTRPSAFRWGSAPCDHWDHAAWIEGAVPQSSTWKPQR